MATLLGSGPLAGAAGLFSASFSTRPYKFVSCEAMLEMKSYSTDQNILPAVQRAIQQIRMSVKDTGDSGSSLWPVSYAGNIKRMSKSDAQKIIERLNGIVDNLKRTNLDEQYLAFEVRGDDIAKALSLVETRQRELTRIYNKMYPPLKATVGSRLPNLAASGLSFLSVTSLVFGIMAHVPAHKLVSLSVLALLSIVTAKFFSFLNKYRRDQNYGGLARFLNRAVSQPDPDQFYIDSSNMDVIPVPAEFHKMLMGNSAEKDAVQYARHLILKAWAIDGYNAPAEMKRLDALLNRAVQNAGDLNRYAYVDQIVYFNKSLRKPGEPPVPVWLFVYRAFRSRKGGKRPSKKEHNAAREKQWDPGLKPVPVETR